MRWERDWLAPTRAVSSGSARNGVDLYSNPANSPALRGRLLCSGWWSISVMAQQIRSGRLTRLAREARAAADMQRTTHARRTMLELADHYENFGPIAPPVGGYRRHGAGGIDAARPVGRRGIASRPNRLGRNPDGFRDDFLYRWPRLLQRLTNSRRIVAVDMAKPARLCPRFFSSAVTSAGCQSRSTGGTANPGRFPRFPSRQTRCRLALTFVNPCSVAASFGRGTASPSRRLPHSAHTRPAHTASASGAWL